LADASNDSPPNFILPTIIEEEPRLVRTLNAHYANAAADGGLDADERGALFDVLARHFTRLHWPRSGGMDATRRSVAELQDRMIATRWKADLMAVT